MMPHVENQELILEAAFNCDFAPALEALMNDPNAEAKITREQGKKMLKEMIERTSEYLPSEWRKSKGGQ